jgi:hypothetical protein
MLLRLVKRKWPEWKKKLAIRVACVAISSLYTVELDTISIATRNIPTYDWFGRQRLSPPSSVVMQTTSSTHDTV